MSSGVDADADADLLEALRQSAAEADTDLAEAIRLSLGGSSSSSSVGGGGGGAPLQPNARIDTTSGSMVLLAPPGGRLPDARFDRLIFEDLSIVRAGAWALAADGRTIELVQRSAEDEAAPRGLSAEDAGVKWCTQCGATMDGRWNRNAYTFRCAACGVDLCGACFAGAKPCAHDYAVLPPISAAGGGAPRAPPPPWPPRR